MRKFLALLLMAAMTISVCGVAFAEEAAGENVVTIAMETSPNLDTQWNAGSTGAWLLSVMYEGLYSVTETGFKLSGAESVAVNDDATVWTFALKQNAKWNDGQSVTANDYVYAFKRLVNPEISTTYMLDYGQYLKNGAAISGGEKSLDELGVTAIDDYTLEIQLENPCTFFDSILTYSAFYPLREDCVLEDGVGDWAWDVERSITNGPMKMVSCDEDQQIVMVKNENYYGAADVALDKLVVKLIDDSNTTLQLLETGEVDLITSYPSEETERLQQAGLIHSIPALSTDFLMLHCENEPTANPLVRQALSWAIDRDYLCNVLLLGTKAPATAFVGNGFPGSSAEADFRTEGGDMIGYDEEKARELLAEAGYPDGEGFPVLTCSYSNSSADYTTIFEYLQAQWEEVLGITVVLEPLEKASMIELRGKGQFEVTPQNWGADYMDASNMLSIFVSTNSINRGKFNNPEYDAAYSESLRTVDQAKRMELLHKAESLLIEDMGIIPLYHRRYSAIYSDDVLENVVLGANGKPLLTGIVHK